ncbi:uncharacterized protein [Henckelia pumila]|uniref:uncharacterized protein isoform X2 n=1 Tax=Henckelia pumila TaxID=405737 RepID=UPI003C6E22F7
MEIHNPAGDTAVISKRRKRRRGPKKATSQIVNQMYVDLEASKTRVNCEIANNSLAGGNLSAKRKQKRRKVKGKAGNNDEVKSRDQLNSMLYRQLPDNSLRQEIVNQMDVNLEASKTRRDCEIANNSLAEGNVSAKRKKRKKVKGKAGNNDEVKSRDQLNSSSYGQLRDNSLRQEIDDKLANNERVQNTNQDMIDIETVNLTEGIMNQRMGQSHSMSKLQLSDTNLRQEICGKLIEIVHVQHTDQNKVDTEPTVNLAEGNVSIKRKRKKKRIKRKTGNKDELQDLDQSNSASNLQSDNNLRQEIDNKLTENEDVRSTDHKKMDIESTYNLAEGNKSMKRKKKRKKAKSKDKNKDKVQCMDPANDISNLQLSEKYAGRTIDGPMGLKMKVFPCESQQKPAHNQIPIEDVTFQNVLNKVNNGLFVVEGTTSLGPSGVKEAESKSKDLGEYPSRPPISTHRRKLLVLDVNGLLAYIVMPPPKDRKADKNILRRAVFKRPFCDDFLKFCFQNFDVGIWSSRAKEVIDRIVDYLLGNLKPKLLFCWNMSHSTQSGFKTLENIHKPLVCKELRKIWENDGCKFSWKNGQYNESNTLLIDDSPYKALLNPLHTAIFPHPYHYEDKDDNSLGPGGHLRVYLEGLLESENVQEYVEHHPFGQSAINETNVSWQFYSGVLQKFSNKIQARDNPTPMVTSSQNLTSPPRDKVLDLERNSIAHSTATPINTINPEVRPIHSSLALSAAQ